MLVNILNSSVKLPLNRIQIVWNYCSFLLLFSSSRNRLHSICSFCYCCFLCVKDIYFKMCFHFNQFSSSLSKWNVYRMPLHINSMILWLMTLKTDSHLFCFHTLHECWTELHFLWCTVLCIEPTMMKQWKKLRFIVNSPRINCWNKQIHPIYRQYSSWSQL